MDINAVTIPPESTEVTIRALLASLSNCRFLDPLTDDEVAILRNPSAKISHVHRLGNKWTVKFYLGGSQRCFGFWESFAEARRLADLLVLRYNGRRTRSKRILTDDDFNITLARATKDAEGESDFVSVLCQIDALLPEAKPRPSRRNIKLNTVGAAVREMSENLRLLTEEIKLMHEKLDAKKS